jgi:flagellar basal-body rod protein FlgB
MFFYDVVNHGAVPAMEKMLAFTEARQRMLSENVANIDTPGYRARQLDAEAFQGALREALDARKEAPSSAFRIEESREVGQDEAGRLVVTPTEEPAENILFHDRTNARIEKQMAEMAENGMMHEAVSQLLRDKFQGLLKAIRGRVA